MNRGLDLPAAGSFANTACLVKTGIIQKIWLQVFKSLEDRDGAAANPIEGVRVVADSKFHLCRLLAKLRTDPAPDLLCESLALEQKFERGGGRPGSAAFVLLWF